MALHPGGPGTDNAAVGAPPLRGRGERSLTEEFTCWGYQRVRKVNERGVITRADVV